MGYSRYSGRSGYSRYEGSAGGSYSNTISDAQVRFVRSLLADRLTSLGLASVDAAAEQMNLNGMTKQDASTIIERLKGMPVDFDPSVPQVVLNATKWGRGNRPGACSACGHVVDADTGFYWLTSGGQWQVHHKVGECSEAPAPVKVDVEEGFYKSGDQVVQVYMTKNKRLAGKIMSAKGAFEYVSGAIRLAEVGVRLTPAEVANEVCLAKYGAAIGSPELLAMAVQYGTSSGSCMFCQKVLNTPESNPKLGGKGYGPKCAENYGLPWGDITNTVTGQVMTRRQWRDQFRADND